MTSAEQKLRVDPAPKGMLDSLSDFMRARLGTEQPNIIIHRSDMPVPNDMPVSNDMPVPNDMPVSNIEPEAIDGDAAVSRCEINTGPITAFEQAEIDDLSRMRDALYSED